VATAVPGSACGGFNVTLNSLKHPWYLSDWETQRLKSNVPRGVLCSPFTKRSF
jgi:hypothetical protein